MRRQNPTAPTSFLPRLTPMYSALAALAFGLGCTAAQAEQKILEEIIVTSQKRAQTLQEVPISVAAITSDTLEKMSVDNIEDLTAFVPNIHFTETGLSTQVRIRGMGSDNSQGFEQSVGIYKDGIYHARAQLFRAPMFDLERVEVMRGPQGTLFGKNSIAGAIDMIAARPTDHLSGRITGSLETEFDTQEINGFISGPLTDTFKGRLALRYYDDPGYMQNITKGTDEASKEETSARLSLEWTPNSDLNVLFIAEHNRFDVQGRPLEITLDNPAPVGAPFPNATYAQILSALSGGAIAVDNTQNYLRQSNAPEFSDNKTQSATLRVDYDRNGYTFTSVTGLLGFDYDEGCDCDFTPLNFLYLDSSEEYRQFSQELRVISPAGETIEWLGGLFYQNYEQTFLDTFSVPQTSPLSPLLAARLAAQGVPGAQITSLLQNFPGSGIDRRFEQDSDAWAIFGEATWHVSERWKLALGGRYTEEKKTATKILNMVDTTSNNAILNDPALALAIYEGVFYADTEQGSGHHLYGWRKESAFTPSFTASFQANNDALLYGKLSRGYKAGGFDPRSNTSQSFGFGQEKVTALELGSKLRLGGRHEVNVAFFVMDYDDLQISQFDGAVGFNVGNAKSTLVQGIEIDGRSQIINSLSLHYGVAILDFEYKDFENGNCHYGQGGAPGTYCDYTGQRGVYTPELTLNGGLSYSQEVGAGLVFNSNLDVQWVDKQQVHVNLDPLGEIDAYTLVNLRLGLDANHWGIALLGKNLLDEDIISYSANMPLSETLFQTNTYYSFLRRPRTIALEGTFRF